MSIEWIHLQDTDFTRKEHNYMLTESLGLGTAGCRCQNVFAVLLENGELIEIDQQSDYPVHLRKREQDWIDKNLVQRDGTWYMKFDKSTHWDNSDELKTEVIDGVEHVIDDTYVAEVNGTVFEIDPCSEYSNANWDEDLTEIPDGMYLVLLEHACWTETTWEGYREGDSEHAVALISAIPLDYKGMFDMISDIHGDSEDNLI
jgi:hypothetical protein